MEISGRGGEAQIPPLDKKQIDAFLNKNKYYSHIFNTAGKPYAQLVNLSRQTLDGLRHASDFLNMVQKNDKSVKAEDVEKAKKDILKRAWSEIKQNILEIEQNIVQVPYISLNNLKEIEQNLKSGDILLFSRHENKGMLDVVRIGQNAAAKVNPKSNSWFANITHAAISLGGGDFAEATPPLVRISSLADFKKEVKLGDPVIEILVYRPLDPDIGINSAKMAIQLAKETNVGSVDTSLPKLEYAYKNAAASLIKSDKMGPEGKKRFMKWALWGNAYWKNPETMKSLVPSQNNSNRSFYCSNFVGWALQAGAAEKFVSSMQNIGISLPPAAVMLDDAALDVWVKQILQEHGNELDFSSNPLDLDVANMSPRSFIHHLSKNEDAWNCSMHVVCDPADLETDLGQAA